MESYDEFCTRILSKLQSERMHHKPCSTAPAREEALSSICWHGRAVLPPVLSEKQRREMNQYRKRATQLETERQTQYNNNLLNQIQAILWTSKAQKILDAADPAAQRTSPSPKTEHKNGFRIHDTTKLPHSGDTESNVLASKQPVTQSAEFRGVIRRRDGEKKEIQEEFNADEVSLQNLLKKSREFIEKENGRQGSKVISSKAGILAESPSEKENEGASSLNGTGSELPCYISCYPPPSQTSQSNLISPEPSLNARPHRGRPRPISACSIFLSYPLSPTHPSITANGKPQEVKTIVTQDALTPSPERRLSGVDNAISNQCAGQSRFNPVSETVGRLETSPVDPELTSPLFRRRCHTLDSHLSSRHQSPLPDRSQERRPRFMAGITARTPTRLSPPGSMNKTFTRESPVSTRPLFMGPGLSPDCPPYTKLQFETEGNLIRRTDEMQWQVQALEEVQTSLEEDRGFRMSRLVADEEGELHLSQESEERGKILWAQGGVSPLAENGCEMRAAGGCYPIFSPLSTLSPGERSPRHSVPTISFPAAGLDISSPSLQAPIYMRAINHGTGKTRHRLSQVFTADQQRALFHLTAVAKGFLTRRLLNTEKVKHLRQTVQDTQEFIRSFSTDAPKRTAPLSEQDLCLQERVRAQLRAALFDIHDIFFAMSTEERLSLLQQDRDLRTERKLRVMEKAKSLKDKVILSAATQKSLDRKKQSRMGESPGQTRRAQKPKSPPTKRILQPSQGQNSPVTGQQLLRRGSYKKTPEERVQHSERLKKQHSLG